MYGPRRWWNYRRRVGVLSKNHDFFLAIQPAFTSNQRNGYWKSSFRGFLCVCGSRDHRICPDLTNNGWILYRSNTAVHASIEVREFLAEKNIFFPIAVFAAKPVLAMHEEIQINLDKKMVKTYLLNDIHSIYIFVRNIYTMICMVYCNGNSRGW